MRIIMVHNRYLTFGGEDESTRCEVAVLRRHGHSVLEYVRDNRQELHLGGARTALRCIWSHTDYRELRRDIRSFRPDVVHVQNFFPLISPAVYYAAAAENVPVVQALRNYRILCPAATMLRRGMPCESCVRRRVAIPGVVHGCYRGSRMATAAVAAMTATHRLCGTWSRRVAVYIATSEFMRSTFISAGFDGNKLAVKPNFVETDPIAGPGRGGYLLYAGRLSEEKGIGALLAAWRGINGQYRLNIIGDGPMRREVEQCSALDSRICYLGSASPRDVLDHMGKAEAVVVPSIWHEPFGRTVVEAFAKATPVIASSMGALSELVRDGETGLLYGGSMARSLEEALHQFFNSPESWPQMRQNARLQYEARYTAEANYSQLLSIYERAIHSLPSRSTNATTEMVVQ